jgi:hypothetical protein
MVLRLIEEEEEGDFLAILQMAQHAL